MTYSVSCKELGLDCRFVARAETEEDVIDSLIRHVQAEHEEDWYEMEEIYQAARSIFGKTAA